MIMARGKKLSRIRVSVPYRGATFLNQARTFSDVAKNVSVPYRGATFLNNPETPLPVLSAMIVSVPYRGATFLNSL